MFSISVGHCWQIQCTAAGRNSRIFGKVRASKYVSWHLQRGPLWKMDPKATTWAKVTWVLPVQPARLVLVQIPCICFNFKMNLSKIEKCICLNWRRRKFVTIYKWILRAATTRAKVTRVLPVQLARHVFVKIPKCICLNPKIYFPKFKRFFFFNWKKSLSKLKKGSHGYYTGKGDLYSRLDSLQPEEHSHKKLSFKVKATIWSTVFTRIHKNEPTTQLEPNWGGSKASPCASCSQYKMH